MVARQIFELNPALDRAASARVFARDGRVQLRDVLTAESAREVRRVLAEGTRWGIAWQAADGAPQAVEAAELATGDGQARVRALTEQTHQAAARGDYAFRFARYPMLDAYLAKWDAGGVHDILLEYVNAPDFLDLVREVTALPELVKADAQATLYAPGHFLGLHDDSHVGEGWRIAYVLNFASDDWRPDWGGYLSFFDDDGDIVAGWRPRFNALNLFAVPRRHAVSFVPPFAPLGRYAITGWFRDR